jgi:(S)-sulfolactate dehydrogenase
MPDIVISEPMHDGAVEELWRRWDVVYDPALVDRPDDLAKALADARALIVRNRTQVRGALLDAGKNLKVIGRLGVGLDNIDLEACKARGIAVCPATGANAVAVAEYVIAMALVLLRGAYFSSEAVSAGAWPRMALVGREAAGKQLGLIGFGSIARATAERAAALGMRVAAYDPYLPPDDPAWKVASRLTLEELLASSDAISLHVPLTQETRGLLRPRALSQMKPGSILINTSRGGIVDEEAVVNALREGRLGGAALDVFEHEPLDAKHGAMFRGVPNLILTPHIAGVTVESNIQVSTVVAQAVLRHLESETAA